MSYLHWPQWNTTANARQRWPGAAPEREGGAIVATGAVGAGLGPRHAFTRALLQMFGTASRIMTTKFQAIVCQSRTIRGIIVRFSGNSRDGAMP